MTPLGIAYAVRKKNQRGKGAPVSTEKAPESKLQKPLMDRESIVKAVMQKMCAGGEVKMAEGGVVDEPFEFDFEEPSADALFEAETPEEDPSSKMKSRLAKILSK